MSDNEETTTSAAEAAAPAPHVHAGVHNCKCGIDCKCSPNCACGDHCVCGANCDCTPVTASAYNHKHMWLGVLIGGILGFFLAAFLFTVGAALVSHDHNRGGHNHGCATSQNKIYPPGNGYGRGQYGDPCVYGYGGVPVTPGMGNSGGGFAGSNGGAPTPAQSGPSSSFGGPGSVNGGGPVTNSGSMSGYGLRSGTTPIPPAPVSSAK